MHSHPFATLIDRGHWHKGEMRGPTFVSLDSAKAPGHLLVLDGVVRAVFIIGKGLLPFHVSLATLVERLAVPIAVDGIGDAVPFG
jgi:hypothetical protein